MRGYLRRQRAGEAEAANGGFEVRDRGEADHREHVPKRQRGEDVGALGVADERLHAAGFVEHFHLRLLRVGELGGDLLPQALLAVVEVAADGFDLGVADAERAGVEDFLACLFGDLALDFPHADEFLGGVLEVLDVGPADGLDLLVGQVEELAQVGREDGDGDRPLGQSDIKVPVVIFGAWAVGEVLDTAPLGGRRYVEEARS